MNNLFGLIRFIMTLFNYFYRARKSINILPAHTFFLYLQKLILFFYSSFIINLNKRRNHVWYSHLSPLFSPLQCYRSHHCSSSKKQGERVEGSKSEYPASAIVPKSESPSRGGEDEEKWRGSWKGQSKEWKIEVNHQEKGGPLPKYIQKGSN